MQIDWSWWWPHLVMPLVLVVGLYLLRDKKDASSG
jgi:hypothetical protein